MSKQITIRKGTIDDTVVLQDLFVNTILTICSADYDNEQLLAWTAGVENKQRWSDIMTNQSVLVALYNDAIVGFGTLEKKNYLDLLYVHKDYQRHGIAHKLYNEIEKEVIEYGQKELIADVSKTAKLFFEKMGFKVVKEQSVNIKNVELINYQMIKVINA